MSPKDVDDVIQETYCRLAMLDRVDHIESPAAYFFSVARNLLIRRLKQQRLVPFAEIAELDALRDDRPSPEQEMGGKLAYAKATAMIAALPERCGEIIRLKKIEGWSQKQIAAHLGTTEKAVEKQLWLGVRLRHRPLGGPDGCGRLVRRRRSELQAWLAVDVRRPGELLRAQAGLTVQKTSPRTFVVILESPSVAPHGLALPRPADVPANDDAAEDIIVIGVRGSLRSAQATKRDSLEVVDAIVAEDVGELPDRNIAEALQRIPGVQIQRNLGEGSSVAVRGLTQVRTS